MEALSPFKVVENIVCKDGTVAKVMGVPYFTPAAGDIAVTILMEPSEFAKLLREKDTPNDNDQWDGIGLYAPVDD